jgi:hypothetical protein
MGEGKENVTICFTIEILEGYDCMGSSFSDSCDFNVEFTEEEIVLMKRLVAASEHDSETNLMPILEDQAPELFHRIDEKAREAMTEFFWLEAAHAGDGGVDTDYGDLFMENYRRDLESGDFVPSDDYEPEEDYDDDEDLAYIEWYEREKERMSYEDAQWFRERYNETFDGIDVSEDQYICFIPDEILPKA